MDFPTLFDTITDWQLRTFGSAHERGPVGPLKHLAKEVLCELLGYRPDAVTLLLWTEEILVQTIKLHRTPTSLEEHADCQILLMEAVRRSGHTAGDLLAAVARKHAVNLTRTYPRPRGDEISEHEKEGR